MEKLGYNVSATGVQQYATDEAIFSTIKQRGLVGMVLALLDLVVDPLNLLGLPAQPRGSQKPASLAHGNTPRAHSKR